MAEGDEIIEKPSKIYIDYKHGKNFCEICPLQSYIKVWLDISPDELNDPLKGGRDVSKIGHHGTGQVEMKVTALSELDYVMGLIKQAYLLTV